MAKIMLIGAQRVNSQLKGRTLKGRGSLTVHVGYRTGYALYVHENLTANHPNGGQAKYLEEPSRTLRPQMRTVLATKLKQRWSLEDALYAAGELLYNASQDRVPVLSGKLKASGYIEVR